MSVAAKVDDTWDCCCLRLFARDIGARASYLDSGEGGSRDERGVWCPLSRGLLKSQRETIPALRRLQYRGYLFGRTAASNPTKRVRHKLYAPCAGYSQGYGPA